MELNLETLIQEDRPKVTRAGGSGREKTRWEEVLAPLKTKGRAGKDFRIWEYPDGKKDSANSRKSAVMDRLREAVPNEKWNIGIAPIPGDEDKPKDEQTFGVYVTFTAGDYTPEEIAANAKAHQEASDRVRNSRAAAKAKREAAEAETGSEAALTAKQQATGAAA